MGLKSFFDDAFEDIEDFGQTLLDNPVDAIVAASIVLITGGTASAASLPHQQPPMATCSRKDWQHRWQPSLRPSKRRRKVATL